MVVGVCTGMVETIFLCKCLEFLRNGLWAIIRIILIGCAITRDIPFYFVDDILGCCAVYPIELKKGQVIVHCYQVIFFFVLEKVCCKLGSRCCCGLKAEYTSHIEIWCHPFYTNAFIACNVSFLLASFLNVRTVSVDATSWFTFSICCICLSSVDEKREYWARETLHILSTNFVPVSASPPLIFKKIKLFLKMV